MAWILDMLLGLVLVLLFGIFVIILQILFNRPFSPRVVGNGSGCLNIAKQRSPNAIRETTFFDSFVDRRSPSFPLLLKRLDQLSCKG